MKNQTWNHPISDIMLPIVEHPERDLVYFGETNWSPYACLNPPPHPPVAIKSRVAKAYSPWSIR